MTRYSRVISRMPGYPQHDFSDPDPEHDYHDQRNNVYIAHDKDGKAIARMSVQGYTSLDSTRTRYSDSEDENRNMNEDPDREIIDNERTHDSGIAPSNGNNTPRWDRGFTRPAESGEQLVMFGHYYEPPRSSVSMLHAKDSMAGKTAAMTLLGMADIASRARIGRHLQPSRDLSDHSGALVNRLVESGAVDKSFQFDPNRSNKSDFRDSNNILEDQDYGSHHGYQDLTERVPAARAHIREVMGKGPKNKSKNEQLQLEGFE